MINYIGSDIHEICVDGENIRITKDEISNLITDLVENDNFLEEVLDEIFRVIYNEVKNENTIQEV